MLQVFLPAVATWPAGLLELFVPRFGAVWMFSWWDVVLCQAEVFIGIGVLSDFCGDSGNLGDVIQTVQTLE